MEKAGNKESSPHKRLVILDTHAILHRAYHALPDMASAKGEPTGALYGFVSMLLKIINDLKPDYVIAALDLPTPTYRHIAYEQYKSQRHATDEALVAQIIRSRDLLDAFSIPRYECEGFEADDVIGTIANKVKQVGVDVIIASGDMDTMQLVDDDRVRVYTLKKGLNDVILYNEHEVNKRFGFGPTLIPDYKGLRGDPSDNIPGVKGVGEKTASIAIATFGSIDDLYEVLKKDPEKAIAVGVKEGMVKKMLEQEEDARFSKMLAEIRLDVPIDFMMPEKMWRESVSKEKILDMLSAMDIRSLLPRVTYLLENRNGGVAQYSGVSAGGKSTPEKVLGSPRPARPDFSTGTFSAGASDFSAATSPENISPDELEKIGLAVWVLNSNVTQPTIEDMYHVGAANRFAEVKKNILASIKENKLSFVYEKIELPLSPVLRTMEQTGVLIDRDFLAKLSVDYQAELDVIAKRVYVAAGGEFNINSPKQLGDILFDKMGLTVKNQKKTAGGARSTRESELEKMRDAHPIIADILEHRELHKLLTTYIDAIPSLLGEDGRLHTSYIQAGTTTGRLASQNPNLQNIPIKTERGRAIRRAFVAGKGMRLVSFDYSQVELRIAALLSGDKSLSDIFMRGGDVHAEVATRVFNVREEDVAREQRRRAKVINFGILYGMGVNALKDSLGTSRTEAQEFYNQYFAAFPQLAAFLDGTKADASRLGYTETYFGRRRYFEGIRSSIPYVRASAERMAINAPIQGTSADIIKLAMIEIERWIDEQKLGDRVRMLLQVHDELVFEVAEEKVTEFAEQIKQKMEYVLSEEEREGIPFPVEGKIGENWGEMKEL